MSYSVNNEIIDIRTNVFFIYILILVWLVPHPTRSEVYLIQLCLECWVKFIGYWCLF